MMYLVRKVVCSCVMMFSVWCLFCGVMVLIFIFIILILLLIFICCCG